MTNPIRISDKLVGNDQPVFVIAEVGINHNGSLDVAKRLIDAAFLAGCDAVKFQKRTPEKCVPLDQRDIERDTPWGRMTRLHPSWNTMSSESSHELPFSGGSLVGKLVPPFQARRRQTST